MHPKNEINLPPPDKKAKRQLTLESAMDHLQHRNTSDSNHRGYSANFESNGDIPQLRTGQQQEMEAHLLELQAEVIRREDFVSEKERKLMELERELNEKEALLEARRRVIESSIRSTDPNHPSQQISAEELDALKKLKAELDAQESALKEGRRSLRDRERYIEECENSLVAKSMELSEREAQIEQSEEDKTYERRRG